MILKDCPVSTSSTNTEAQQGTQLTLIRTDCVEIGCE